MKRYSKVTIPFTVFVVFGLSSTVRAAVPGAVFTTTADGSVVNANLYPSKCDVYLNGGPGPNAPAHAAALPAGDYFFQVTDPSGQTLLSTDAVSNRRFTVSAAGVITAYTGVGGPVHPTGISQDHPELGAITIQLANTGCPNDLSGHNEQRRRLQGLGNPGGQLRGRPDPRRQRLRRRMQPRVCAVRVQERQLQSQTQYPDFLSHRSQTNGERVRGNLRRFRLADRIDGSHRE